jgi:GNAT superfamily N-acetyltransferase
MSRSHGQRVNIRTVRPEDFPALYAMDQQCFPPEIAYSPDDLRYFLEAKDSLTLVAEDADGGIAGFALAQMYRARPTFQARLITIDVVPEFRRKGIGSDLLKACEAGASCHALSAGSGRRQFRGPSALPVFWVRNCGQDRGLLSNRRRRAGAAEATLESSAGWFWFA